MDDINSHVEHILNYMRLQKLPQHHSEAHDMMSLARDIMDVTIDYFFQGRYTLHAIWIKDDSSHIISPEIALQILGKPFEDTELFPCERCGISQLSQQDLVAHIEAEHKNVAKQDIPADIITGETIAEPEACPISSTNFVIKIEPDNDGKDDTTASSSPPTKKRKADDRGNRVPSPLYQASLQFPAITLAKQALEAQNTERNRSDDEAKDSESNLSASSKSERRSQAVMQSFKGLNERLLSYFSSDILPTGLSEVQFVLDMCRKLYDVAVDYFTHGSFSLHEVLIKDPLNRTVNPQTALHLMREPNIEFVLYPCKWCGLSQLNEQDLRQHIQTEHHDATRTVQPSKSLATEPPGSVLYANAGAQYDEVKTESKVESGAVVWESYDSGTSEAPRPVPSSTSTCSDTLVDLTDDDSPMPDDPDESSPAHTFACNICGSEQTVYDGGVKHYLDVHGIDLKDPAGSLRWPCIHCRLVFDTNHALLQHLKTVHKLIEYWPCTLCPQVLIQRRQFARHMMGHVLMAQDGCGRIWNCSLCDFSGVTADRILAHMNKKHLKKEVTAKDVTSCPRCGAYDLTTSAEDHLNRPCVKCPEMFCCREQLVDHQVSKHIAGHNWKCVHCKVKLANKHVLKRHILTIHEKEYWPCPYCSEVSTAKKYLVNHLINLHHSSEKLAKQKIDALQRKLKKLPRDR